MIRTHSDEGDAPQRVRPDLTASERLQLVVESIQDYAIYMLDPDGVIKSWSPGAERLKGYRADEVLGKSYSLFFRPTDVAEGLPKWQLSRALVHGKTEEEGWRVRKDGSLFWANVLLSTIGDESGAVIGYAKITRDITDKRRLRELEHSLQRMNDFLAMLGHELRTPLAAIRFAAACMVHPESQETEKTAASERLDRQVDQLARLLDGLLDAGRLTSGKLRVMPAPADFRTIVAQAVESLGNEMEQHELHFSVDLPEGDLWVVADDLRIGQVLQNLLSNAMKFTPSGGHIELRAEIRGYHLLVEVKDDGKGMDPATIGSLFHLFAQGTSHREGHQSGLGIGLAVSRAIIEMHGGALTGTSAGAQMGSTFRFELPGTPNFKP